MPIPADYKTVAVRLADFLSKHPNGSLQPADPAKPFDVLTIGDQTWIVYVAAAYREPDDPRPGIGSAWEPYPGPTNFTKDSELQNAETSAWGRAIVAALASESKHVASHEDVQNRDYTSAPAAPRRGGPPTCEICGKQIEGKVTVRPGGTYVHDPLCEKPADDPNTEPF